MSVPATRDDREGWMPERVVELNDTISALWPGTPPAGREQLATGLLANVNRSRVTPTELHSALVECAEKRGARSEWLPNVGTVMEYVTTRRRRTAPTRRRLDPDKGPPWTPSLYLAAFVHAGGPERRALLSPEVSEALGPWLDLVESMRFRCEHAIEGDPAYDGQLVHDVNERAAVVYDLHGGVGSAAALHVMAGGYSMRPAKRRR